MTMAGGAKFAVGQKEKAPTVGQALKLIPFKQSSNGHRLRCAGGSAVCRGGARGGLNCADATCSLLFERSPGRIALAKRLPSGSPGRTAQAVAQAGAAAKRFCRVV